MTKMASTPAPEIVGPVWEEHTRTITVQAYRVEETERIITVSGLTDVAPGNYVVNEGGFLSVVDADSFEALYPAPDETPAK